MSVKKTYTKPALSIDEQIDLLRKRGLQVDNLGEEIEYFLRNVNYYYLSIYFKFFQNEDLFIKDVTIDVGHMGFPEDWYQRLSAINIKNI